MKPFRFFYLFLFLFYIHIVASIYETHLCKQIYDLEDSYYSNESEFSSVSLLKLEQRFILCRKFQWLDLFSKTSKKNTIKKKYYLYTIIGNVMLDEGNIEGAKDCLLKSVPAVKLKSVFWLRHKLACRMLDISEIDIVIEYFNIIRTNYDFGHHSFPTTNDKIDEWMRVLENGNVDGNPDLCISYRYRHLRNKGK